MSLLLKWVCIYCRQHIDGSFVLFIQSLCLLIGEFIPFAFKVIIDRYCLLPYYCFLTFFFLIVPLYFFFACSLWFDFLWWYTYIPFSLFFVYLLWVFALWLSWGLPITTFIYEFILNWWQLKFDTIVKLNIIPMFLMSHFTSFYLVCPLTNCCNHSYFYYFCLSKFIIPL